MPEGSAGARVVLGMICTRNRVVFNKNKMSYSRAPAPIPPLVPLAATISALSTQVPVPGLTAIVNISLNKLLKKYWGKQFGYTGPLCNVYFRIKLTIISHYSRTKNKGPCYTNCCRCYHHVPPKIIQASWLSRNLR
jgi:hypothetical protein